MGLIAEERGSFMAIVGDAGTNSQDPKFSPEDGLTQVIQAESLDKRELNVFQLGCNTAPGLNNPHDEISGAPARKGPDGETALHVFADLKAAQPKKEKKAEPSDAVPLYQLFSYADPFDYLLMATGTVGAIAHGAALPVFFLFFGKLLNGFGANSNNPNQAAHVVAKYALDFLYLGLVVWIASWAEVACWMQTGERQAARMRLKYLEAMLRQDVGFFDMDGRTNAIVTSIASDALLVQDALSEKMGNFIHYMATFVAGFAVGFTSLWKLALVTLAVVPAIAIAGGFYAACLTDHSSKSQQQYWEAGSIAEQAIAQVRTVYSFVGETRAVESYSKALQTTLKLGYKGGMAKGLGMGVTYGVLFCSWALLLWYAGTLVRNGSTNGGKALSTIFAVIIGGISLGQASPNLRSFVKAKVGAYKIFEMIKHKPSMYQGTNIIGKTLQNVQGHIEFRNVNFSYPSRPDVPIFHDFSLSIPAGKTVAIVGNSGSGKSTVVSLIERFYDPNSGEVLLDGHNIRLLHLKWLRGQIGLVNQEPALFATSIKENILYGKEGGTDAEVEEASKSANAHSFIAQLPDLYHTQVGERGVQMSGGQKQRIAIARAILKNPTILLLDEATSALDNGSEQSVQEALDRVMVGRTTVVVAHRLSTVRNADFIAVVQNGVIVETGTHEQLFAKGQGGAYAALVRLQEMAMSKETCPSLNRESSSKISQLSVSKSGRTLSRQYSAVSDNPSEVSTRGPPENDPIRASSLWRLMKLNKPEWPYALVGIAGSIVSGFMNPAFAIVISQTLKSYYNPDQNKMEREIGRYALFFIGLGGLSVLGYSSQHFFFGIMGENLVKRVREMMFAGILRNEISWFDVNENNSGQVAARLSADATTVRGAIGDRISLLVQNFALLVATCAIAFFIQWRMASVILATFPVLVGAAFVEQMFLRGFAGDIAKAQARATMLAGEAISNIRTVVAFNAEAKVLGLYEHELEIPMQKNFWRGQVAGFGYGFSQLAMFGAYGLGLWYGSTLVKQHITEFGSVIKVFMVLIIAAFAVAETLALTPDLVKGGQALASVFEVLDRSTQIDSDEPDGEIVVSVKGDIELKKIMFAYPSRPEVPIFKDFNLKLRAGKSLALVGSSGSGKSSVIALIERFYDPITGRVLIDKKDIKKLNLKSLRRHIGLVQQEPALFATSIYDNILYGRDGASEAEIMEAAKLANAHTFISALPDGYKTHVGERGVQLSGGQKQRVAIARAVLKNPAILLLDEATSALDAESEQIVQDALDRLMQGRTTVMVAHRLSTIRNANSIAVIQDGAIIEEGTHHELVTRPNGAYSRLVSLQPETCYS